MILRRFFADCEPFDVIPQRFLLKQLFRGKTVAADPAEIIHRHSAAVQKVLGRTRIFEFDVTLDQIEKLAEVPLYPAAPSFSDSRQVVRFAL